MEWETFESSERLIKARFMINKSVQYYVMFRTDIYRLNSSFG